MPRVIFGPTAGAEFDDAADWYRTRSPASEARFVADIEAIVVRIGETPQQFPVVRRGIRRAQLARFPYALYFRVEPRVTIIVACFHGSRDPRRWQERR